MPDYTNFLGLYKPSRNDNLAVDTTLADNFSNIDSKLGSSLTDSEGIEHGNLKERLDVEHDKNMQLTKESSYYHDVEMLVRYDDISITNYTLTKVSNKDSNGDLVKLERDFASNSFASSDVETARSFANRNNATFAVNASTFDTSNGNVRGNNIHDGVAVQSGSVGRWILGIKPDNTLKAYEPDTPNSTILADGSTESLIGFMPIIQNNQAVPQSTLDVSSNSSERHPRQVIGQMSNNDFIFLTCDGRNEENQGMTMSDCIRILLNEGVEFAYNLDGGGSTQTVLRGSLYPRIFDNNGYAARQLPDFLYFSKQIFTNRDKDINNAYKDIGKVKNQTFQLNADLLSMAVGGNLPAERVFIATQENDIIADGVSDDTNGIQRLLDLAKNFNGIKITFPVGTYKLTRKLFIYEGTHIDAEKNAVFDKQHNAGILQNSGGEAYTAYAGNGNITISGGKWRNNAPTYTGGTAFIFAHARNLVFKGLEMLDVHAGHCIEISSSNNVLVDGCKFFGMYSPEGLDYSEAIQLDVPKSSATFPWFGSYDNTPCEDVVIQHCQVDKSELHGSWGTGVGSHGGTIGRQHKNIIIQNNIFRNTIRYAVRSYNWNKVNITNNIIIDCGSAIMVEAPPVGGENSKDANGVQTNASQNGDSFIFDNNLVIGSGSYYSLVTVRGNADGGQMSNISITNNIFKDEASSATNASVLIETNIRVVAIANNKFNNINQNAIYVNTDVWELTITGNVAKIVGSTGFLIQDAFYVNVVGNILDDIGYDGLWLQWVDTVSVSGNTIAGVLSGRYHYRLSGEVQRFALNGNTARNTGKIAAKAIFSGASNSDGIITGNNFAGVGADVGGTNVIEINNLL